MSNSCRLGTSRLLQSLELEIWTAINSIYAELAGTGTNGPTPQEPATAPANSPALWGTREHGAMVNAESDKMLPAIVRWRDWAGHGLEHAHLSQKTGYIAVQSTVISGHAFAGFAALYSLKLDPDWRVLEVQASMIGVAKSICLHRTEDGRWFDGNNASVPELQDAFDVDLSITPLTNTLPIRRLRLGIGESAEITTAYIAFPELTVSPDLQRYTRLSHERYRYESMNSDFVRELVVDQNGFVITYPDLFQRAE